MTEVVGTGLHSRVRVYAILDGGSVWHYLVPPRPGTTSGVTMCGKVVTPGECHRERPEHYGPCMSCHRSYRSEVKS